MRARKRAPAPPRHPPFCGHAVEGEIPDNLTHAGAVRLASRIEAAWRRIGITVRARVEFVEKGRAHYAVRLPDLVNGLPVPVSP